MITKGKHITRSVLIFMVLLTGSHGNVLGQWDTPPPWQERIFFGGNFGMQFGNITRVEVSPLVGYAITPRLAAGVGVRYEYYSSKVPGYPQYDTHIYGGTMFSRYMVIRDMNNVIPLGLNAGVFGHVEYEALSLESAHFDNPAQSNDGRFYLHSVLIGGGLYQPIGRRSGFLISVLWNLNESIYSIYNNPVVRIGFNF